MIEEWRDVVGYEGSYQVSNMGRIKGLTRKTKGRSRNDNEFTRMLPSKIMKPKRGGNTDYWYIALCKDGGIKYRSIHRLVAIAFIENPENKAEVNHKDGNKKNNLVDNLEWMTRSENLKHRYRILGQTNRKTA